MNSSEPHAKPFWEQKDIQRLQKLWWARVTIDSDTPGMGGGQGPYRPFGKRLHADSRAYRPLGKRLNAIPRAFTRHATLALEAKGSAALRYELRETISGAGRERLHARAFRSQAFTR